MISLKKIVPIEGNWYIGDWERGVSQLLYQGPHIENIDGRDPRNVGIALFEGEMRRGVIKAKVHFPEKPGIARIIIGYDAKTGGYYSVGIGGYDIAYLVDRYDKHVGWRAIYYKGKRAIIRARKTYSLEVELDGRRLVLKIDDTEMFRCSLDAEKLGKQIGLFSWGKGKVTFSDIVIEDIEAKVDKPKENIITKYDIAVSFASEDREIIENYVKLLENNSISVFYDRNEKVDLWGKDLYEKLDKVYRTQAKYCVIFISKFYKEKLWTNHERRSAQARAFKENREYVLPVKLDDTTIPGIRETIGYIDLRESSVEELAELTVEKLRQTV